MLKAWLSIFPQSFLCTTVDFLRDKDARARSSKIWPSIWICRLLLAVIFSFLHKFSMLEFGSVEYRSLI